jgi:hypothetical protein
MPSYVDLCSEYAIFDGGANTITRYFCGPSLEIVEAEVRIMYAMYVTPFGTFSLLSVSPADKPGRYAALYGIPEAP